MWWVFVHGKSVRVDDTTYLGMASSLTAHSRTTGGASTSPRATAGQCLAKCGLSRESREFVEGQLACLRVDAGEHRIADGKRLVLAALYFGKEIAGLGVPHPNRGS